MKKDNIKKENNYYHKKNPTSIYSSFNDYFNNSNVNRNNYNNLDMSNVSTNLTHKKNNSNTEEFAFNDAMKEFVKNFDGKKKLKRIKT